METVSAAVSNEEAMEAWNGVLFDRFVKFREIVTKGLGEHGEEALRIHPPRAGERVLDVGCGFGDTASRIADMVGPEGEVVGIDVAERFIEAARAEADSAGIPNVSFIAADVQTNALEQGFDFAFSRFGTMFFANPVTALRNVCASLVPGGRLCIVVWRRKLDNDWMHRAELVVEKLVTEEEDSDEPTCGPGPFSMSGADVTSDILISAGFEDVTLSRFDTDIQIGDDLDHAVEFAMALGPAGEALRLAGSEERERMYPQVVAGLRDGLADFVTPNGVRAPSSTWIVSARKAGGSSS